MQKAEVVLSTLTQKSKRNSSYVFDRLYRNLFNPDFYVLAYSNIYAKEGNMTEGVDGKTIDGFNMSKVHEVIEQLKTEAYSPTPVRRVHIPKKNGQTRVLDVPSFIDKLVQEVVRLILEAMYEPVFSDNSHGFRPEKSCHTALTQIKTTCKGTNWVVEGDIKGFFDNISHQKLREILSKKIADGRFINLIGKFLQAGYMEFRHVHPTLSGIPQGGIVSPILANIYLHEFDVFMEDLCKQHSKGKVGKKNPAYQEKNMARFLARKNGEHEKAWELLKEMRTMPTMDPFDKNYIRVKYTRYADDFVIMIIGSKHLAEEVREKIRDYLKAELHLDLSLEKTHITHLNDQRVRFLGYDIAKTREDGQLTKNSLGIKKRAANETIQLLVPTDVITEKLQPFIANGKAVHHNARINQPLLDTLQQYNSEIRGLYQYYCLATDVSTKIGRFRYYHYDSLLKTVARKEKCSRAQVISKYGVDVKLKQAAGTRKVFGLTYQTKEGIKTMTYFNDSLKKKDKPLTGASANGMQFPGIPVRHQIIERMNVSKCELCVKDLPDRKSYEVHHIRKLKDIKEEHARRGDRLPQWKLRMCSMNRKTLVVCLACHQAIHTGQSVSNLKEAVKNKTAKLGTTGEPDTLKGVRPVRRGVQ